MSPSDKLQLKLVGKITEAHGLKGEIFIHIFSKQADWVKKLKQVSLGLTTTDPARVYAVQRATARRDGIILLLEGCTSRNDAESLEKQFVFIDQKLLVSQKGEAIFLNEILNFTVLDGDKVIGPIEGFSSNGPQDLLVVRTGAGLNVEIPFVEAFLRDIDFAGKKVLMDLPPGLVEEVE